MKKSLSRILSVMIAAVMLLAALALTAGAAEITASGKCGANAKYTLDSDGVLTISGTGDMYDYAESDRMQPWREYIDDITKVVINDGITRIGTGAFYFMYNTTEISVPDSVESIGAGAFSCTRISTINIPEGVTRIESSAFHACDKLTSVTIPDGVTYIGDSAFDSCGKLTEVKIPDGVTYIGDEAFFLCGKLTSVSIPDSVTHIGEYAFYSCRKLTEVKIPDGVTVISRSAFSTCSELAKVTIPDSVTRIEEYAFNFCPLLDITIPAGVTYLGEKCFGDITGKPYYQNEANWVDGVLYYGNHLLAADSDDIGYEYTIRDGTVTIGQSAFSGCSSLRTVEIPDSVVFIGKDAFSGAYLNCDITISENVKYIANGAFNNAGITNIYVDEANTEYASVDGILYNADKTQLMKVPAYNAAASIEIPYGTTVIEKDFFKGCKNLQQIIIPETVTKIEEGAFENCKALKTITIPSSVTNMYFSFSGCSKLSEVTILNTECNIYNPNLSASSLANSFAVVGYENSTAETFAEKTGAQFFALNLKDSAVIASGECGESAEWKLTRDGTLTVSGSGEIASAPWMTTHERLIKKVVVKEGISHICSRAFYEAVNLTAVTLPSTLTFIGSSAFYLCESLKTVNMPEGAVYINDGAFQYCYSLESVAIGDGSKIYSHAFYKCTSLASVTLGKIKLIDQQAFNECTALTDVYFRGSLKDWYRIYERFTYGSYIPLSKVHFETEIETKYKRGNVFAFGSFPQSIVEDQQLIEQLNASKDNWVYVEDTYKSTKYAEIELDGNRYRALLDDEFENAVNWFVYEPVFWRVIDPANGLIFAEIAVDRRVSASNFAESDLRKWLNNDFYSQAFSVAEAKKILTTAVSNVSLSTRDWSYTFEEDTTETIFIPSTGELTNGIFGFSAYPDASSTARQALATDYLLGKKAAKKTYVQLHTRRTGSGGYFFVDGNGMLNDGYGLSTSSSLGIRPAMYVDIENIECSHSLEKKVTAATCTAGGFTVYSCRCGYSYTADAVAATGHSYVSEVTTAPTHLADGVRTYTCSACSDAYTEKIEKLEEHAYVPVVTEPTCTEKGYTKYTCECDDSYVDDYVDATGHSFNDGACITCGYEGYVDKGTLNSNISWRLAPDGTLIISGTGALPSTYSGSYQPWYRYVSQIKKIIVKDGITEIPSYAFEYCEYADVIVLPGTLTTINLAAFNDCGSLNNLLLPASLTAITGNGAFSQAIFYRCESLTDVYYMGTAEEWHSVTNNNFGYSYDSKMTLHLLKFTDTTATCTKEGIQAYYEFEEPSLYGPYYDENKQPIAAPQTIPALGHSYKAEVTESTCTQKGYTTYTCVCGDTYTEAIDIIPHKYTAAVTAPTCTERGFTTYTCVCGDSYVGDYVKAKGHSYSSTVTVPATHTLTGVMTYTCHCGDAYTRVIDKLTGHEYKAAVTAPTCTEKGYTTYTCICGDSYVGAYVKEKGHSYSSTVTVPATHTGAGVMTYTCHCGDTYTEVIDIIPHKYVAAVTAPTCTEKGYTTYTCVCGDSYVADYTDATGHSHQSSVTAPATHTEAGVITYTCACGDTYTEAIATLPGHTYESEMLREATCSRDGEKIYYCECGDSYTEKIYSWGHQDWNSDGSCDECGESFCSHICHKTGIMGLFAKIAVFFWKLFGINPVCECGMAHY